MRVFLAGHQAKQSQSRNYFRHPFENIYFSCFIQHLVQAAVYDLVQSRKFEIFIIVVITINMLVMMVQHYDQPKEVTLVLDILTVLPNIKKMRQTNRLWVLGGRENTVI